MIKKRFILPLAAGVSLVALGGHAGESDTGARSAANTAIGSATSRLHDSNMPEWLRRTDVELSVQEDLKPTWSIETIQPLFMDDDTHTFFFQGRLGHHDDDQTLNLGLGYRYLTPGKDWLLGVNAWHDRTFDQEHERFGLGAEAIGEYLTFRANRYDATSGWKTVTTSGGVTTEEKALDGWDAELEAPIPYLPWARVTAKYFEWDAINVKNVEGHTIGLRMNPTGNTELTVGATDDNTTDTQAFMNLTWHFGRPAGVEFTAGEGNGGSAFVKRDLEKHRLDKVRRHHDIVVERNKTGSGGVVVGRGA